MTAIVLITDIPSNIVTVEQLHVWTGSCLANLNSNVNATEGENYSQRAAQSGVFYIAATDKYRQVSRVSTELSTDHLTGPLKNWMYAQELSNKPLTAAMKAN
jgi:hypothetical protein